MKRFKRFFYWKGLNKTVRHFIRQCSTFQASKCEPVTSPCLLKSLPISEEIWVDISMDFILRLSKSEGKDVSFVVVDRLSISAHITRLTQNILKFK